MTYIHVGRFKTGPYAKHQVYFPAGLIVTRNYWELLFVAATAGDNGWSSLALS